MAENPSDEQHPILHIPQQRLPRHIAIIMDGNGRWAQNRNLPRGEGHRNGSKAVRATITEGARLGIQCLTLYSFSTENWKRPHEEVETLMDLYAQYLVSERPTIMDNNIKVRHLGEEETLPPRVAEELQKTIRISQNNTGMVLCLALNYSGRSELLWALKKIARDLKDNSLRPDDLDEPLVSSYLDTASLPDPDLLIRTAGERRISNFMLWQISYAELYVTDTLWPDFTCQTLHDAIKDYASRHRRFGGLKTTS